MGTSMELARFNCDMPSISANNHNHVQLILKLTVGWTVVGEFELGEKLGQLVGTVGWPVGTAVTMSVGKISSEFVK